MNAGAKVRIKYDKYFRSSSEKGVRMPMTKVSSCVSNLSLQFSSSSIFIVSVIAIDIDDTFFYPGLDTLARTNIIEQINRKSDTEFARIQSAFEEDEQTGIAASYELSFGYLLFAGLPSKIDYFSRSSTCSICDRNKTAKSKLRSRSLFANYDVLISEFIEM